MISCFASEMSRTISRRPPFEDVVLDAVELHLDLAQHRERGVDAGVDDLVEQVARALRERRLAQVRLLAVALEHRGQRRERDVREGDQVVRPHEQVHLRGQDPRGLLLVEREVQDDEDVVVVLVQLRAVVARVDVLEVERVEVEVGLQPVAIGRARRFDVDPADPGRLDDVGRRDLGLEIGRRTRGRAAPTRSRERRQGDVRHAGHRSRRCRARGAPRDVSPIWVQSQVTENDRSAPGGGIPDGAAHRNRRMIAVRSPLEG